MSNMVVEVKGTTEFMGKEIPNVYGGFGENKKSITDKYIAEIHGMETFNVRKRINDYINRFKKKIDYIDLKDKRIYDVNTLIKLGYSKQSITQAEHIYLLSERGYAKLIKIMDTDLAWEIHDKLIDEYFTMREIIKQNSQLTIDMDTYNIKMLESKDEIINCQRETINLYKERLSFLEIEKENLKQNNEFINTEYNGVVIDRPIIDKDITVFNNNRMIKFIDYINSLPSNTYMLVSDYSELFNSYNFFYRDLGVVIVNKFLRENNLMLKGEKITDKAKVEKLLEIRQNKNHKSIFMTKKGILYISKLIINTMPYGY